MWGDPAQRGNAQNYAANNPVNYTDPLGLGIDDEIQEAARKIAESGGNQAAQDKYERLVDRANLAGPETKVGQLRSTVAEIESLEDDLTEASQREITERNKARNFEKKAKAIEKANRTAKKKTSAKSWHSAKNKAKTASWEAVQDQRSLRAKIDALREKAKAIQDSLSGPEKKLAGNLGLLHKLKIWGLASGLIALFSTLGDADECASTFVELNKLNKLMEQGKWKEVADKTGSTKWQSQFEDDWIRHAQTSGDPATQGQSANMLAGDARRAALGIHELAKRMQGLPKRGK